MKSRRRIRVTSLLISFSTASFLALTLARAQLQREADRCRVGAPSTRLTQPSPDSYRRQILLRQPGLGRKRKTKLHSKGATVIADQSLWRCSFTERIPSISALADGCIRFVLRYLASERSSAFQALQTLILGARTIRPPRVGDDVQSPCEEFRNGL